MNLDGDWYESLPSEARHGSFLRDVARLVHTAVFSRTQRSSPVVHWHEPEHLRKILALTPSDEPANHEELLRSIKDTIEFSVSTGHPYFINQLFSSVDPYGLAGQWVTASLNASVYTYEVAPVFTLMEAAVLEQMRHLVGFTDGDGIFCPGGSMANGIAMSLARYHHSPNIKRDGLCGSRRLVLFTSEDAHYSVHKMAALLGIGEENVIQVKTDSRGRMDARHLETLIQKLLSEGAAPFMVSATAGTTVLGAFDPLPALADICATYKLWLHVDAAWGGGLLFSRAHRHKLAGIERAHSVAWNPHKLLAAPQQCSVLLVRQVGTLQACHSRNASYLFQKDKFYDTSYDTGDKHIQCGRRADVFNFWLMWKAKGSLGFEKHVDSLMDCASHLTSQLRDNANFTLVQEPEFINVCFWFVPPQLRGCKDRPDYQAMLHKVAPKLKERMMRKGSMMIGYQPLRNKPNFFRFVLQNSGVKREDVDYFLEELERLGKDL